PAVEAEKGGSEPVLEQRALHREPEPRRDDPYARRRGHRDDAGTVGRTVEDARDPIGERCDVRRREPSGEGDRLVQPAAAYVAQDAVCEVALTAHLDRSVDHAGRVDPE